MSSDESASEEEDAPAIHLPQLLAGVGAAPSDDDDSDSQEDAAPCAAAPSAAPSSAPSKPPVGSDQGAAGPSGSPPSDAAGASSSALPSADDLLSGAGGDEEAFLHTAQGPEFDASKGFRPPPMSHGDLAPVGGKEKSTSVLFTGIPPPPPRGWQGEHKWKPMNEDEATSDYRTDWGRRPGAVRLNGSVCYENDDERGRRVRYGAHAMLAADPWSACNPNFAMKDSSITRGKDRGRTGPHKNLKLNDGSKHLI